MRFGTAQLWAAWLGAVVSVVPLRLLVAGQGRLARAALAELLARDEGLLVSGRLDPGAPGLEAALDAHAPEVLVLDLGEGDLTDFAGLRALRAAGEVDPAGLPLLVLVASGEDAREAWDGGAAGVLPREAGPEALGAAIRAVALGLWVGDPGLADVDGGPGSASSGFAEAWRGSGLGFGVERGSGLGAPLEAREPLTAREREVLGWMVRGLSNGEIADQLGISAYTVKDHLDSVYAKLPASGRVEAAVRAVLGGIVGW